MNDPSRSAKHFLPKIALPPYPEPYDQMRLSSGKCTMYLSVELQGHGVSGVSSCGSKGCPTEWTQGTQLCSSSEDSSARICSPIRVITRIEHTTYGLSVTCTPYIAKGECCGPIAKGTTYIVRPRIEPANSCSIFKCIFSGSSQL